jgi:AAA+ ATPase superfamily predicted ATPase
MAVWGVVSGMPSYPQALRGNSLGAAVVEHVLEKTALLYREVDTLLAQEVRGVGPAMLQAIAYGATEPNQIAQRVGKPVTGISGALGYLLDYGLIERRIPFDVPNPERTRRTRYVIADNYLAFWFRFVLPNRSPLERGQAQYVWQRKALPEFDRYMGQRFERACREFMQLEPSRWTHHAAALGVWWNASDELDIVGHDGSTAVLIAEAKWTNERVGLDVLRTLRSRVALLKNVAPDHKLVLFSKSGFRRELVALRDPSVVLIKLEDMLP